MKEIKRMQKVEHLEVDSTLSELLNRPNKIHTQPIEELFGLKELQGEGDVDIDIKPHDKD